jgi:hypothetical protein
MASTSQPSPDELSIGLGGGLVVSTGDNTLMLARRAIANSNHSMVFLDRWLPGPPQATYSGDESENTT